jgi:hypothetical protein
MAYAAQPNFPVSAELNCPTTWKEEEPSFFQVAISRCGAQRDCVELASRMTWIRDE